MFEILTIPFNPNQKGFDADPLNRFVINKHIKNYRAEFFAADGSPYWTVFMEYDPVLPPATETETSGLDEPQQILLERLRAWRKERAEKDGVPVYILATNRELREIVVQAPRTLEALKSVKGFGKGKTGKYGADIIELTRAFYEKT
jgi:superfamily II DNA helicase RecQ